MNNNLQKIKNFQQLVLLFNAGAGEFHFLNNINHKIFNLKFVKLHNNSSSPLSLIYAYFSRDINFNSKLNYNHIGRYHFEKKQIDLRTDALIPEAGLKIVLDSLNYILGGINTGEDLTSKLTIYYSPRCCRCGHPLNNQKSLAIGMGPECEEYYKDALPKIQLDLFNVI